MESIDRIVNVNPALQPAGAMNPDVAIGAIHSRVFEQGTDIARRQSGDMLRLVFGPTSLKSALSKIVLCMRICFGSWIMSQGLLAIVNEGISFIPIILILAGLFVGLGLFTRIVSAVSMLIGAYLACSALSAGHLLNVGDLYTLAFLLFAYIGPGRYSLDALMRRNIFRSLRRRQMRRLMENRFSYRAYEFAHYQ